MRARQRPAWPGLHSGEHDQLLDMRWSWTDGLATCLILPYHQSIVSRSLTPVPSLSPRELLPRTRRRPRRTTPRETLFPGGGSRVMMADGSRRRTSLPSVPQASEGCSSHDVIATPARMDSLWLLSHSATGVGVTARNSGAPRASLFLGSALSWSCEHSG